MDPESFTVSFRGDSERTNEEVAADIEDLLVRFGFQRTLRLIKCSPLICLHDLDAAQQLLSAQLHGQVSLRPMSALLIRRVTRDVRRVEITLERSNGTGRALLQYCNRNSFPVIGVELWTAAKPRLPGGLLTLSGLPKRVAATLRRSLLDLLY